ncbi:phospholipase C/P1 nuclease [Punctularia strigosozonata HHB-11173 SS5]|uniref:phospholipase C/P1 nuclease n=1 Tax=Punctularia strigosozonata (strain HHB-11173) TaxID=741275 RepID=UPI0004418473|nr:phospholipase C/P1 nuclease [Punctularia strigosozonata HHB-11173 SS5]EIN09002.1 phospholipase C/P1 nuclease [Punctularia strigosozonata HHB-11173 SS5]
MRLRYVARIAGVIAAWTALPTVGAWGAAGHEIVATIAQIHLHPSVLPTLCWILDPEGDNRNCHLARIATWADRVRNTPGFRWSASLHYIGAKDDWPSSRCEFPGEKGWAGRRGGNVLGAIRNVTGILVNYADGATADMEDGDALAAEALKFLVHFVGDMHMPLHLTGRDRGGNSDKVLFDGRLSNLHSVWDGLLIAKALRTIPGNYTRPLPSPQIEAALRGTIYDPYIRRVMFEGLLEGGRWHDEVEEWLTCPASVPLGITHAESGTSRFLASLMSQLKHALFGAYGIMGSRTSSPGDETDDANVCPYHWAAPIHKLNCEIVWPKALDEPPYLANPLLDTTSPEDHHHASSVEEELAQFDEDGHFVGGPRKPYPWLELDTPEYAGVIAKEYVVEHLLAMGGIRLAAILNWLFAEVDEVKSGRESRRLFV